MKLKLETNIRNPLDFQLQLPTGAILMMTAPRIDARWIFRVALGKNLALLAVPQFGGVNIHLQSGASCEINVPYETDGVEIMRSFNGHRVIPEAISAEAIEMLKTAVKNWRCGA